MPTSGSLPRAPRATTDEIVDVDAADLDLDGGASWHGLRISGDLAGIELDGLEVAGCHFVGVTLTGAELSGATIRDSTFEDCELSGVMFFTARWERVALDRCRASGLVLGGARLRDVAVRSTRADDANLRLVTGERVLFEDCDLRGAELYDAALSDSAFLDCDLRRVEVSAARLMGTRLHGSNLEGLRGAKDVAGVVISPDQQVALGIAVLAALDVSVVDRDDR